MNILLVRRPMEAVVFADKLLGLRRPGLSCIEYVGDVLSTIAYDLRSLQWTPEAAPSAIVYPMDLYGVRVQPLVGDGHTFPLQITAEVAKRDGCVLVVLVPPVPNQGIEDVVRREEDKLFESMSNVFVLHGADFDKYPVRVAALVLDKVSSGMFGRYRVLGADVGKSLGLKPLLLRDSLVVKS